MLTPRIAAAERSVVVSYSDWLDRILMEEQYKDIIIDALREKIDSLEYSKWKVSFEGFRYAGDFDDFERQLLETKAALIWFQVITNGKTESKTL